jgi:hypothetical protein
MRRIPLAGLAVAVATLVLLVGAEFAEAGRRLPPKRGQALIRWLEARNYQAEGWVAEPTVHPSVSAHGMNVRTWLSPRAVEDLASGAPAFRKGTAFVKELYLGGTDEVAGWAVMRKLRKKSGRTGRGWFFFETFDGRARGAIRGRGKPICVSCHQAGQDYLLSPFRP